MSERKISLIEDEYYHIFNRGNGKMKIFLDDQDHDRFVKLLFLCNSTKKINFREDIVEKKIDAWEHDRGDQIISIGAWVLMPNHFHLYLTFPKGLSLGTVNNISLFMKKVCTSYTMYFNKKYKRKGSLFEGKFKSVYVGDEIQAKYLFSYIHLNPIKLIQSDWKEKGIKNIKRSLVFLSSYKWSSYLDYMCIKRRENILLNREVFPDYFSTKSKFQKEILEWVSKPL